MVAVAVAACLLLRHAAVAQEAVDPAALQRDVAMRYAAGDHQRVIEATEGAEKALRAKPKDPDFVPRMRLSAELLTRRAVAERKLGRLDAAEKSLEVAAKLLGDKDVQRAVAMFVRAAGDKAAPAVVPLELTNLELVDAQLELVLALIEAEAEPPVNNAADAAADPGPRRPKARGDLRQTFNALLYQSRGLRQGLEARLEKADPIVGSSPFVRALASDGKPMLHAARAVLIVARTQPPAAADSADAPPDPVALMTEALEAVEKAMAPTLATPTDDDRPAAQATAALALAKHEAALVRAPYLEWRARARIVAGDTAGARADVQAALAERTAAGQRAHPDLVESLLVGGEAALTEAEQTKASGDLAASRAAFEHAVTWLSRARDVAAACPGAFDAESPLRQRIDDLLASAVEARQSTVATVATTDAVDAAARRALRALGARPASPARPAAAEVAP